MTCRRLSCQLSLTSGKRRVTTLGFPRERRAKAFGMQSHTWTILCGVRSMGNEWDFCRLPKCRETTEEDKLLLAVWEDAGHVKKAGVSFSFLPFKKAIQSDPSCQQPIKCPQTAQDGTRVGRKSKSNADGRNLARRPSSPKFRAGCSVA